MIRGGTEERGCQVLMAADTAPQPQPQLQPDLDEPDRQSAQRDAWLAEQGDVAAG